MSDHDAQQEEPTAESRHISMRDELADALTSAAESDSTEPLRRPLWKSARVMVPIWVTMLLLVALGLHYGIDKKLLASGFVLIGLASSAFTWMIALVSAVPLIGPLLLKVLAIPFIWLLNAIGYLISIIAIRRGYSKDVLTYRGLTIALIIGLTIGFIMGKLL